MSSTTLAPAAHEHCHHNEAGGATPATGKRKRDEDDQEEQHNRMLAKVGRPSSASFTAQEPASPPSGLKVSPIKRQENNYPNIRRHPELRPPTDKKNQSADENEKTTENSHTHRYRTKSEPISGPLHTNDVLCGRGNHVMQNPGNPTIVNIAYVRAVRISA